MSKNKLKLQKQIVAHIVAAAKRYPQIDRVILFGSWALGNAKQGSDINLALSGDEVEHSIITSYHTFLEEENTIPHFFDVIHLETIENKELKQHILTNGVTLYSSSLR